MIFQPDAAFMEICPLFCVFGCFTDAKCPFANFPARFVVVPFLIPLMVRLESGFVYGNTLTVDVYVLFPDLNEIILILYSRSRQFSKLIFLCGHLRLTQSADFSHSRIAAFYR